MPEIDTTPLRDPEAIAARDRRWLEHVYQPDDPQLTLRSALTGMILGSVLSASNLYIGLKIGWSFGMGITASVVGFAIFAALGRIFPGMRPFSMLENNTAQTAASAAAYMSSAGLVSSIPAMAMLRADGTIRGVPELDGTRLTLWMLGISVLGVVVAIPLKRTLINAEQLRFPSGVVCAETIRTMHSAGAESLAKARSLFAAGAFAAAWKLALESKVWILRRVPEVVAFPGTLAGHKLSAWSLGANTSLMLYAAGAIIGLKVTSSLLAGALVSYLGLGPFLLKADVLRLFPAGAAAADWPAFAKAAEAAHAIPVRTPEALHAILRSKWSVWPGTALMVSASLAAFAFRWRMVARAFASLARVFRRGGAAEDPLASVEVPSRWFAIGLAASTVACVWMQHAWFGVPIGLGVVSVAAAFLLSVVAARATGETNVTPIGAMGKITQLLFGVLLPGNAAANLMTATVTAGAASHSADLLMEVKTGYLLGGAPRKQFWAQMLGVLAGAVVCVPVYFVVARPEKIGKELAAPAAIAWASVAKLLKDGAGNLPKLALPAIAVAAALGVVLAILDELAARATARATAAGEKEGPAWTAFVPSATGLGIAMVIDFHDSFAMFVGAAIAWWLARRHAVANERYTVSVASGFVAGEGLMGIVVIVLRDVLGWLK